MSKPAILGGEPELKEFLPIAKPTLPSLDDIKNNLDEILKTGMITNYKNVEKLEQSVSGYVGVKYAVAVNSATSALIFATKLLNLKGEVIVPSFTFVATAHSLVWNRIKPVFADCEPDTFNIDPNKIEEKITNKTTAIMPVDIFGSPYNREAVKRIADKHNLKIVADSSHAMGSIYNNEKVGKFGDAEIFCMTPTKIVTAGEGGIVCTNNSELAENLKGARDYGNFTNYDCRFISLSGRLSEFNAIIGQKCFEMLENNIAKRNNLVNIFKREIKNKVEGIDFQKVNENCRSTYQSFALIIDKKKFGLNKFQLAEALKKENVMTKTMYFDPPVHKQNAYKKIGKKKNLEVTNEMAKKILCIPLFSHMPEESMIGVASAVKKIFEHKKEIAKALR